MDIKKLRKRLNLSQAQLAKKLGVNVATVSRWETGKHKVSPLSLRELNRLEV